ncbi:stage VI sporulation protein F [Paenibacillus pasadenensis]|uniref:stage VI sporulation protein F n=1 Tax=Paenibacillus pasadenensis TaxID=217090 RepID=UPI0020400078|nr:stage VI sporulation protein F [Paenibacillus pasadenensis]
MSKHSPKDILGAVNKKTGKNITEQQVKKLASGVTPSTIKNEDELRRLVKQVAAMAKVPLTEKTMNDIVAAVKSSGMNMGSLESLMSMMMKK